MKGLARRSKNMENILNFYWNPQEQKVQRLVFIIWLLHLRKNKNKCSFDCLGIPNQRKHFTLGPSDRIGTNFTPTAKHLTISGLRERKRLAWLKRKEFLGDKYH